MILFFLSIIKYNFSRLKIFLMYYEKRLKKFISSSCNFLTHFSICLFHPNLFTPLSLLFLSFLLSILLHFMFFGLYIFPLVVLSVLPVFTPFVFAFHAIMLFFLYIPPQVFFVFCPPPRLPSLCLYIPHTFFYVFTPTLCFFMSLHPPSVFYLYSPTQFFLFVFSPSVCFVFTPPVIFPFLHSPIHISKGRVSLALLLFSFPNFLGPSSFSVLSAQSVVNSQ